jgi:hypothetical protein
MIPMQAVVISIGSVTKCFDASDPTHLAAVTGNRDSKQEDLRFLCYLLFKLSAAPFPYWPKCSSALRIGALETLIVPCSG